MMDSTCQLDLAAAYDLDAGFEPQTRARSNTWPLTRPEGFVDDGSGNVVLDPNSPAVTGIIGQQQQSSLVTQYPQHAPAGGILPAAKKNTSRRNAWGNLSYADLITQAITSSQDKRLTLSQIYEWMVQNVPYFKDKGDSNSSAGWKNSIRHNLSLHNRFMRVQNEGTGKSSWWMINPDAKPGKSARRRATSMETSKFEKRRGRVKKKVEALRNSQNPQTADAVATSSPSSSISEGLDLFPDSPLRSTSGFQFSPEFRPRTSSNASSCGNRLSPIPAEFSEPEWPSSYGSNYSPEELAGTLTESMKLVSSYQTYQQPQQPKREQQQKTGPPPSYYEAQYQRVNAYEVPSAPQQRQQSQRCLLHHPQPCSCQIHNLGLFQQPQQQQQPPPQQQQQQQPPQNKQSPPTASPLVNQPYLLQQNQTQETAAVQQQQLDNNFAPGDATIPSTMMGQLMGALDNSALLDDLNLNLENLQGFDCDIDEVIKHELQINGTLDINFHQSGNVIDNATLTNASTTASTEANQQNMSVASAIGSASHPVLNLHHHNQPTSLNLPVGAVNSASTGVVYVSTNAATSTASPPSWVH